MWPGFGENARVLDWIFKRTDIPPGDDSLAVKTPIGYFPSSDAINLAGLEEKVDMGRLISYSERLLVERSNWNSKVFQRTSQWWFAIGNGERVKRFV